MAKMEVGKKYKNIRNHEIVVCTAVCNVTGTALLLFNGRLVPCLYTKDDYDMYLKEYKEPIKHVMYFNIYPTSISNGRSSRKSCDNMATESRIGCKRVEFIEGQYDE